MNISLISDVQVRMFEYFRNASRFISEICESKPFSCFVFLFVLFLFHLFPDIFG